MSEYLKQHQEQQHHSVVQPDKTSPNTIELGSHQVDVQQPEEGMPLQIEQRRRSKHQATIAQDAMRRASDDQAAIAPSNVLAAEHLNEPKIEDEPLKKHRGPTMLFEVHVQKMEDRVVVLFNDKGQLIGPTDKVVNEFSKFLGTIAHDYTWAPLIYTNWSKVPHNDEMWGYGNQVSAKNVESHQQQDNMHTSGPVSFARKYYELKNKEGRSPSKTRKRMKEIEALQESRLSSSDEDPFDKVMKKERLGRLRLYGRGVCATNLKRNDVDKPQALAPEFIDAIRLSEEMQKDFDAHKEKMDVELKAEKDKVANMQKELDSQKAVLDAQKAELDAQKAKVDHLLVQSQKMILGITPENIAQAVTSQFTSTSRSPLNGSTT
ncbi:LOW QUALITY PROTEIN: hypothetical protein Cgig2_012325 [Carnegiea gigantea]|uniref:Transposase, Ptta/En/Spm, plant n=1 Tax=Carnegiea gigantea TaxID=171969 RepID=A0A9Q1JSU8_9CARY|nr:LOW QUALITY PROTEIN: hypothetical protein Cgig2_012325 [Carnegiea gigantea]